MKHARKILNSTTHIFAKSFQVSDSLGCGYFSTFGGNPVSCAVGLALLHVIRNEKMLNSAESVGRMMGPALSELRRRHPDLLADVRGAGQMWALEFAVGGSGGTRRMAMASAELTR